MDGSTAHGALAVKFSVERVLQKSIFGEILLGTLKDEPRSQRAIKAIRKDLAGQQRDVKGATVFEDPETEMDVLLKARSCPHPNLLCLSPDEEQVETDDTRYVVTPFYPGGELFETVKRGGSLPLEQAQSLFSGIANGLSHMHHELGYTHNDLSLENVLLTEDGGPVICDYGLARIVGSHWEAARNISGKLPYQAPEIYFGTTNRADPQADVFSLGVVLFVLLTGIPPFEVPDPLHDKRYAYIQCGRLPDLLQLWRLKLPDAVVELVSGMLAHNPERRLTLDDVLSHEWVCDDDDETDEEELEAEEARAARGVPVRGAKAKNCSSSTPSSPNSIFSFEAMYTKHVASR